MARKAPIVHAAEHREHARNFLRLLDEAVLSEDGKSPGQLLEKWLDMSFRALRGIPLAGDEFDANEAAYLAAEKTLTRPAETRKCFAEMLAVLAKAMAEEASDFLGPIFTFYLGNPRLAQYFTPPAVADLLAEQTLRDAPEPPAGREFLFALEPACGTGAFLLAGARAVARAGHDPARRLHWTAIDLSYLATCGAFLQASFSKISAVVVHGNFLTGERFLVTPTPMAIALGRAGIVVAADPPPESAAA